jgi:hypothetical protein
VRAQLGPTQPLAVRIAALRAELAALEQAQRQALIGAIAGLVGPGVVFNSRELWAHRAVSPALATALADAGIGNAQQLGKRLKNLGLTRIGDDRYGALWLVE